MIRQKDFMVFRKTKTIIYRMSKIGSQYEWWIVFRFGNKFIIVESKCNESRVFHFNNSFYHCLRRHLGIVLCAWYLPMSEECSNGVNVNPFVQQLHGESVPEASLCSRLIATFIAISFSLQTWTARLPGQTVLACVGLDGAHWRTRRHGIRSGWCKSECSVGRSTAYRFPISSSLDA